MPVNQATLEAEKLERRIEALEQQVAELRRELERQRAVTSSQRQGE